MAKRFIGINVNFLKYPDEMSTTNSIPALPAEKKIAVKRAVGAINFRYEFEGNPGINETVVKTAELTKKKRIGINRDGISANNGRQICLV